MKKIKGDELRPAYRREDLGQGVRGKHFKAYRRGSNLVLLKPDIAAAFPTEKAVNEALRSLLNIAHHAVGP
jgi:hypothetical protein